MSFTFVVPAELPGPSGGTVYNESMMRALTDLGENVHRQDISGLWPDPGHEAHAELACGLAPRGHYLVDGIIGLAAPEVLADAQADGSKIHILVHSLLSDTFFGEDPSRDHEFARHQEEALQLADSVICTSSWAQAMVEDRYRLNHIHSVLPGTDPAAVACGSQPPRILMLGSLTRVKNQLVALQALTQLTDIPWQASLVGSTDSDPEYARAVQEFIRDNFAAGRVQLHGVQSGAELETIWQATDLLVLTSTTETYGMVVTEALARGIPAIVPANTGATEALTGSAETASTADDLPGAILDPSDLETLVQVLRTWLLDTMQRHLWRAAALQRRDELRSWTTAARELKGLIHG
ncbi:glycosyltransferase family 4 protein [Micrococcoides hystricis]|uniref:D-inositol 3-phosphate glycosyltransferase n=1 Tax=Micrococcoides hystricis TaxID=1572761 RepID=A0ABV6PBI3_9MICC